MSNSHEEWSCGCEFLNDERTKACDDHRNFKPSVTGFTISDIHGDDAQLAAANKRATTAEHERDELRIAVGAPEDFAICSRRRFKELAQAERERDEARYDLAAGRYNAMWMVLGCVGAWTQFKRERDRAQDFFWKYDIFKLLSDAIDIQAERADKAESEVTRLQNLIRIDEPIPVDAPCFACNGAPLHRPECDYRAAPAQPATATKPDQAMTRAYVWERDSERAAPPSLAATNGRGSELLNALSLAYSRGPGEAANVAFSELLDYVVGLERADSAVISSTRSPVGGDDK